MRIKDLPEAIKLMALKNALNNPATIGLTLEEILELNLDEAFDFVDTNEGVAAWEAAEAGHFSRFWTIVDPAPEEYYVSHYQDLPIQPETFAEQNGLSFIEGNVIKYVTRYKRKDGLRDLGKAKDCIEKLITNYQKNE
jgi:hypothetical protein